MSGKLMKKYTTTQIGWIIAGAIYSGTIAVITFSIVIAELTAQHKILGDSDLDRRNAFFDTQIAILLLLLMVVFSFRKLRGFFWSEPARGTENTFPAGGVVQVLWIGSTIFIPLWLASLFFDLMDLSDARLGMALAGNFCVGLLGLRIAAGYALYLRDKDGSPGDTKPS